MKKTVRTVFLLSMMSLHLVSSISEVCFFHNTTKEGVYIQCGDLKAADNMEQYQEHLEVQSIQMGWNTSIPVLDYGLFTQFSELNTLLLNNAGIETIAPRAFYGMHRLQELSFYNNKISNVDTEIFSQLYILRVLDLGQNQIEALQDDAFLSLYQLETLILRWNNIRNITKKTLNGLRGLVVLNLRGNRIAEFKSDVFEELYFLKILDLSFNALKEIPSTLFSNQRSLLTLTLESNDIKTLPDKLFENTTDLLVFDVSNNLVTYFQEYILNNTQVETLKIARNHITVINATNLLMYTQYLNEVDLDHNPWNCKSLKDTLDEFQKSQIYFKPAVKTENKHNIEGIACKN